MALTLGALLLLCVGAAAGRHWPCSAWASLTKGFPLVVAPVALAWLVARGERRAALQGAGRAGARVLADRRRRRRRCRPTGFADSLRYHLDRPAQVEARRRWS